MWYVSSAVECRNVITKALGSNPGWFHYIFTTNYNMFLAHLSTTCSWWANVIDQCPVSVRQCIRPPVRPWTITYKIFSSETGQQISMKLHRNDPWVMHFQNTSKIGIPWRILVAMATERKNFKNLLVPNRKGYSFHIWHVASSSGVLPKYFKL